MKNVTLSAAESLIEAAPERARLEQTTLNEKFRGWLADYAGAAPRLSRYDEAMAGLRGQLVVGRKLGRDEMNERRHFHR